MIIDTLVIFVLIFMWIFTAFESLDNLTGGRIIKIENEDEDLAEIVEKWYDKKQKYLITFRILIFFLIAIIASLVFDILHKYFESILHIETLSATYEILPHVLVAGIITVILVLITEAVTRFFVIKFDIYILKFTMPLIKILGSSIFFPVVFLIHLIKVRLKHSQYVDEEDKITTEDEIMSLIEKDSSEEDDETSLEEEEKQMIRSIFDLDDTTVKEIMTPRVDVTAISSSATIDEAIQLFIDSGHSRIPIYNDTIDYITGIILAKDFLNRIIITDKTLDDLAHKPIFIPESKETMKLLNEFKTSHNHFAVIIDEFGGTVGITTLEDILEEIVGEIHDEHETDEDPRPVIDNDGSVTLDARTSIDDVNEMLDIKIPTDEDDVNTIGGYVCSKLGKIPESGENIIIEEIHFTVIASDKRRIITLKLHVIEKED